MALPTVNIHDVAMQNYAYSLTGELGTTGLSPCVAVIILFSDRTIMMEHRSDIELCKYGYETEVLNLLENIAKNIISLKRIHLNIRYAFIIGGCAGKRRKRFQRSLMSIYEEYRKEEQDPSDLLYLRLMYDICESLKIINVSWSIERKQVYGRNDPFIDVLIARRQQGNNYHLFIRQGVSLYNEVTQQKTPVYCGYFSYKLYDDNNTAVQQGNLSLAGAQFYMNDDLAEPYRPVEKDYKIIRDSMFKFIENVARIGAVSTETDDMCPLEYRIIDPNHTFCSKPFPNVIDQRVTSSERSYIINMHNYERRRAYGTNIEKMYWNDDLAEIALRHARSCIFEHDKINQRSIPKIPLSTGQNLAMGYENWIEVIEGWSEEKEYYYHAFPSTHMFNHYTQMIWHSSTLIGCAATICPPFGTHNIPWRFFVCNYITGMLNSNYHEAFKPSIEYHPLHDCQGKVCLYNGTLDLNTCKCQCSTYASGLQCEKLNCSMLPPCPYHSSVSCIAVDVPLECPRLCGLCDRYEILKNIYGEENLAPTIIFTTNEKSSINMKSALHNLQNHTQFNSTSIINTTMSMIVLSASSTKYSFYQMIVYIVIKYLFFA